MEGSSDPGHQDNAKPHTAARTTDTIDGFGWGRLKHPPYKPDQAPSDFYLFSPLKGHMRGLRISTYDDAKEAVSTCQPDQQIPVPLEFRNLYLIHYNSTVFMLVN